MRRARPPLLLLPALLALASPVATAEPARRVFDPGGRVRAVRALDGDGDGRSDLVLVVESEAEGRRRVEVLVARSPAEPDPRTHYPASHVVRIPAEGDLADAGAVSVGRFGPGGAPRLRFLGPRGAVDLLPDGSRAPAEPRLAVPTLLARGGGRGLVVLDAHADLDGDGIEETWVPDGGGDGQVRVLGGTAASSRVLALSSRNLAGRTEEYGWLRTTYVPNLFPADLDGDGRRELLALEGKSLVAWSLGGAAPDGPLAPSYRLPLAFLEDTPLGPEEIRTPRVQVADVDGDGVADLLVTVVSGRRDQLGSLRTTLYHFPGPFRDPATGRLVAPRARLDTESVALHPSYVDLDGDGALDYVSDSIRGTKLDLIQRIFGKEPEITFVGFRFDRAAGTYERVPWFTLVRPYARSQATSNTFGISASFEGDFDGDGRRDLLDLGNLEGIEVLGAAPKEGGGPGDPLAFAKPILDRTRVPSILEPHAVVADLDGDRRADAAVWNESKVFLVLSGGAR